MTAIPFGNARRWLRVYIISQDFPNWASFVEAFSKWHDPVVTSRISKISLYYVVRFTIPLVASIECHAFSQVLYFINITSRSFKLVSCPSFLRSMSIFLQWLFIFIGLPSLNFTCLNAKVLIITFAFLGNYEVLTHVALMITWYKFRPFTFVRLPPCSLFSGTNNLLFSKKI